MELSDNQIRIMLEPLHNHTENIECIVIYEDPHNLPDEYSFEYSKYSPSYQIGRAIGWYVKTFIRIGSSSFVIPLGNDRQIEINPVLRMSVSGSLNRRYYKFILCESEEDSEEDSDTSDD